MIRKISQLLLGPLKKIAGRKAKRLDAYSRWNYIPEEYKYFDLSAGEQQLFLRAISYIVENRRRIEGVGEAFVQGDFLVLNEGGSNSPLYWCFNNWAEPLLLARVLGNNQPIAAMHSLHGAAENWHTKTRLNEHLASRYLENITNVTGKNSFFIGGNCQGAPIAESIAIQAQERLNIKSSLITLDYVPRRQHQGPMLMLFGRESRYNPFLTNIDPISIWQSKHNNFAWGIIDGNHGEYFKEPAINQLRWFIEKMVNNFVPTCSMPSEEIQNIAD